MELRALILRGILKAMKTTSIEAMGMLLSIEPLCLIIVAAAASAAYRLRCEEKWIFSQPIFSMEQDKISAIRALKAPFKVSGAEKWAHSFHGWVQDRLGLKGCQGKGINEAILLGKFATFFQAEIVAILCYAQRLLADKERGRRISIYSDSQVALKTFEALIVNSKLNCRCTLRELARDNEVALVWVSGLGPWSELTRQPTSLPELARRLLWWDRTLRSESPAVWARGRSVAGCGISTCPWRGAVGCRQAKALLGNVPSEGLISCIKKVSRREAGLMTRIFTGHGTLNYHSHKLSITIRSCGKCDALEETSLLLCECPVYDRIRREQLGFTLPRPQQRGTFRLRLSFSSGEE
ncbi:hypothetical protein ACFW04_011939 [Cataglyphis niger]